MKFFITGGAGFIGRGLVESLISDKHQITIFDDLSNSSEKLVSGILDLGAILIKNDIRDFDVLNNSISGNDVVIHLAAKNSVEESVKHPEDTFEVNVNGTKNLLKACLKNKIKNFIAISSAAIYGHVSSPEIILTEKSRVDPTSPYGKSKLLMEKEVKKFSKKGGNSSIILRLFNVYGLENPEEFSGVISNFASKIIHNQPLEIHGDGNQTRDFVAITDVTEAIKKTIPLIEGKEGTIYNIGSGKSVTINELADLMMSNSRSLQKKYTEPDLSEIRFSRTSINLAKKGVGYKPLVTLEAGLKKLLSI